MGLAQFPTNRDFDPRLRDESTRFIRDYGLGLKYINRLVLLAVTIVCVSDCLDGENVGLQAIVK